MYKKTLMKLSDALKEPKRFDLNPPIPNLAPPEPPELEEYQPVLGELITCPPIPALSHMQGCRYIAMGPHPTAGSSSGTDTLTILSPGADPSIIKNLVGREFAVYGGGRGWLFNKHIIPFRETINNITLGEPVYLGGRVITRIYCEEENGELFLYLFMANVVGDHLETPQVLQQRSSYE